MNRDEMRSVMNFMILHRAPNLPATDLAEIFDQLIWCLDDNGSALLDIREEWLRSDSLERVEVALAMSESYPFNDAGTMEAVFEDISTRWPHLKERCVDLVDARRNEASRC